MPATPTLRQVRRTKLFSIATLTLLLIAATSPAQNILGSTWSITSPYTAFSGDNDGFYLAPQCTTSNCSSTRVFQTVVIPSTGHYMLGIYGQAGGTGSFNYTLSLGNAGGQGTIEGNLSHRVSATFNANDRVTVSFTTDHSTPSVDTWQLRTQLIKVVEPVPTFWLYNWPGGYGEGQIRAQSVSMFVISTQTANLRIPGITGVLGLAPSLMVCLAVNGSPSNYFRNIPVGSAPFYGVKIYGQILSGNALGSAVRMY